MPHFPHTLSQQNEKPQNEEVDDPRNPLSGLPPRKKSCFVTCYAFDDTNVFLAYEDGLITCWDIGTKQF